MYLSNKCHLFQPYGSPVRMLTPKPYFLIKACFLDYANAKSFSYFCRSRSASAGSKYSLVTILKRSPDWFLRGFLY